jgi:hypothetical protein
MENRQNSLSNFGNTNPASSFSLNENTPLSFTANSGHGFGQSQQITTSNSVLQQQISNRGSNELQKNTFNTFISNTNQNQLNNNNHLFSTSGNGLIRNTSNTNPGWPNMNNLREYNH